MDLSVKKIISREWHVFLIFFLCGIILIEVSVVLLFLVGLIAGGRQDVFRWNSPLNVSMDIFRCGYILGLVAWGSYPVYLIGRVIALRIKLRKRRLDRCEGKTGDE